MKTGFLISLFVETNGLGFPFDRVACNSFPSQGPIVKAEDALLKNIFSYVEKKDFPLFRAAFIIVAWAKFLPVVN